MERKLQIIHAIAREFVKPLHRLSVKPAMSAACFPRRDSPAVVEGAAAGKTCWGNGGTMNQARSGELKVELGQRWPSATKA